RLLKHCDLIVVVNILVNNLKTSTTHLKTRLLLYFLKREFILQKESGRTVKLDDEDAIPSENTSEHPIEAESLASIIKEDVVPV
nr:hypothetical protein [Tanacetum cinerariifolium]